MIIKRTLAFLSMVSLFSFTAIAHAEMGPYVGMGAGITFFEDDGFVDDATRGNEADWDDTGTAYGFLAGYKFSNNFSVEWNYQDYDYNEYGIDALSAVDMQAWHIIAIVAHPVEESFLGKLDLFGKFGFGESDYSYTGSLNFGDLDGDGDDETLTSSEQQTSESFIIGGGAQFYIDDHFRIRTDFDLTSFNLDVSYGTGPTTYRTQDYTFFAYTAKASVIYMF